MSNEHKGEHHDGCCSHNHHHEEAHSHSHCHDDDECDMEGHELSYADMLIEMADEAWEEVLKDKMKAEILKTSGEQLDQIAKLVTQKNSERWKGIMSNKESDEKYKDTLRDLLTK